VEFNVVIFAHQALLADGWHQNVRISVADGRISGIEKNSDARDGDSRVDTVLPALANLHSHSFQRAMAGMSEFRAAGQDSFWTWRTLMYRFLDRLTPEQMQAFAGLVFMEMQEAGYASVGEFHYVHHQPGGQKYDDPAELSQRIFAAASDTGIGLTHLPVLYSYGGAGEVPLAGGQLRFGNSVDAYNALVARIRTGLTGMSEDTKVGIAPHSLRATSPADLQTLLAAHDGGPVHIHIAEQPKEVRDIQARLGARPVEWLLENAPVNRDWCLIHATHMSDSETVNMARSGAVAGLCPITEANLGDGAFNGVAYLNAGGVFGIGSDSNVRIALGEELRQLEYSQRLRDLQRNVMVTGPGSTGATLYQGAARGGARALGRDSGEIRTGTLADLVAVDSQSPALCALAPEQLLDGLVFAAGESVVTDLWSAGRHMVQQGRHVRRDPLRAAYRSAVQALLEST
jgi:formimidoylglutamate deiminase